MRHSQATQVREVLAQLEKLESKAIHQASEQFDGKYHKGLADAYGECIELLEHLVTGVAK